MAYALITSLQGNSTDSNGFTTSSGNTTGADLIIVSLATGVSSGTISDSKGNTWTPLTQRTGGFSDRFYQFFYCQGGTVGSGHTFSVTGTANFPSLCVSAWSGSTAAPFDVENGNSLAFGNSIQTGSITPTVDNELLVTGMCYDDTSTPTIDVGFTVLQTLPVTGFGYTGQQIAYIIETTATAKNPTFSWTNNSRSAAAIASFKIATGGGGGTASTSTYLMMGV